VQGIVEAYGSRATGSAATWTIITFPFLFAVMFGGVDALAMTAFAPPPLAREMLKGTSPTWSA
jgi:hypothetical protein